MDHGFCNLSCGFHGYQEKTFDMHMEALKKLLTEGCRIDHPPDVRHISPCKVATYTYL